jgi:RNA polymerase sigma-54 factor
MAKMTGWVRQTLHMLTLSTQELGEYVQELAASNPWIEALPAAAGAGEDVVVTGETDGLAVSLGTGGRPQMRVRWGGGAVRPDAAGRKLREEARGLAHALEWREEVLLAAAKEVVQQQADFLTGRCDLPRRLCLRDLAQRLNLHESTVSRVTRNKAVLTPRGRFSLRFLVNDRTHAEVVTEAIRAIVAAEDPQEPWSDPEIAERLADAGLTVARRTVSKYRQTVGLPEGRRRRK